MIGYRVFTYCDQCGVEHRGIPHNDLNAMPQLRRNLIGVLQGARWKIDDGHTYCPACRRLRGEEKDRHIAQPEGGAAKGAKP